MECALLPSVERAPDAWSVRQTVYEKFFAQVKTFPGRF